MRYFSRRLFRILRSDKRSVWIFLALVLFSSGMIVYASQEVKPVAGPTVTMTPTVVHAIQTTKPSESSDGIVSFKTTVSQNKFLQNSQGELYMDVSMAVSKKLDEAEAVRNPVDMVLVLDRSGSMIADKRLTYAVQAIRSLMVELAPEDRLALITFDTGAEVCFPLTSLGGKNTKELNRILNGLRARGSTNMQAGLELAKDLFSKEESNMRSRKVILLSDGEAGQGLNQLKKAVNEITRFEAVVSTIGLGLGFNESVMSSLADHGMGNFAYLENLAKLDGLFDHDLKHSRIQYAAKSEVVVRLAPGMKIIDAGGYPLLRSRGTNEVRVQTGQLLHGRTKSFVITLRIPTNEVGMREVMSPSCHYEVGKTLFEINNSENFNLAILEVEKKEEVMASIDSDIYERSWMNNWGVMNRKVSALIKHGDQEAAEKVCKEYSDNYQSVQADNNLVFKDNIAMEANVAKMKSEIKKAFKGSVSEQRKKQSSYSKQTWSSSRESQRVRGHLNRGGKI